MSGCCCLVLAQENAERAVGHFDRLARLAGTGSEEEGAFGHRVVNLGDLHFTFSAAPQSDFVVGGEINRLAVAEPDRLADHEIPSVSQRTPSPKGPLDDGVRCDLPTLRAMVIDVFSLSDGWVEVAYDTIRYRYCALRPCYLRITISTRLFFWRPEGLIGDRRAGALRAGGPRRTEAFRPSKVKFLNPSFPGPTNLSPTEPRIPKAARLSVRQPPSNRYDLQITHLPHGLFSRGENRATFCRAAEASRDKSSPCRNRRAHRFPSSMQNIRGAPVHHKTFGPTYSCARFIPTRATDDFTGHGGDI